MLQRPVVELLLQSSDSDLGYQNRVSSVLGMKISSQRTLERR